MSSHDAYIVHMRTTINIDDELIEEAQRLTGITEKTQMIREALTCIIQRESARRLALLKGTEPDLTEIPRRRQQA